MALRGQMAGVVTGLCDAFAPWRNLESRVSHICSPRAQALCQQVQGCFSSLLLISVPARRFPRQLSLAAPPMQICYANLCLALKE